MLDSLKAIGVLAVIGVLWVAIPIAGIMIGIVFAGYIVFMLLLEFFSDESEN